MNRRNRREESPGTGSRCQGRATAAVLALAASALLLAPLPALAQDAPGSAATQAEEADLPREARILVQRGLAVLGFDPGPADGLFGPRTRAAIWDWQAAKELDATGYLTAIEAEALAAVGAEAGEARDTEMEAPAAPRPAAADGEPAQWQGTAPRPRALYFPTCGTEDAAPDGCWRELASPAGCLVWWNRRNLGSLTWSGACDDTSRASGQGELKWDLKNEILSTVSFSGELSEGTQSGHWVERIRVEAVPDEVLTSISEGSYMDGKRHGRWVSRVSGPNREPSNSAVEYRHGVKVR